MKNDTKGGQNLSRILALAIGLFLIFSMNSVIINGGESSFEESGVDNENDGARQVTEIEYNNIEASVQLPTGTTSPIQLYLQLQDSTIAGYKNLSNEPFELSIQEISTPAIPAGGGTYQIGDAWITDILSGARDIAGNWTFNIFGKISGTTGDGTLRAEVYSLANGWLFSAPSTESVAGHSMYYNFTWTYDVPGGMTIPAGDRIYVEFWLDATSGGTDSGQTVNPDFDINSSGWTYYDWVYVNNGFWQPTGGNPNGVVGVPIYRNDLIPVVFDHAGYWEQAFTPTSIPSSAALEFDWRCSDYLSIFDVTFYAFIDSFSGNPSPGNAVWSQTVTGITSWASVGPIDVSSTVNSASTYYLKVAFRVTTPGGGISVGEGLFDNVQLTWATPPAPQFILGYDYITTPSSVNATLNLIGVFEIPLQAGWNFISLPFVQTDTSITTVLSSINGMWDYVMWYDASDVTQTTAVTNELVFGPAVGGETGPFSLGNTTITDISLYNDMEGLWILGEDYIFDWTTGTIDISMGATHLNAGENLIAFYNYTRPGDSWKTYATFRPAFMNDLLNIDNTMGFWIRMVSSANLTITGIIPISTTISLHAGWNMVGYPSLNNESVGNALWGTGATKVGVFDSGAPYNAIEVGPTYIMKPGEGYWVHVPADTVWIIDW